MSHPLYNPYTSGKQNSSQGQYGVPSGQGNLRMPSPHMRPGSNYSSSGPSVNLGSSVGSIPSLLSLPSYRPEKRATLDEDIERSVNMHISKAREGVKQQHPGQRPCFPGPSRNELPSSVSGGTSYQSPPSFQGQRLSNIGNPNSTMDWLPTYNKVNKDSSQMFSSASSGFVVSGDGRYNSASEERRDMQSIPGLGDFDQAMKTKPTPPSEPSHPKYTSESAISILMNFGLEKEDLEHLISYPESQITPENLPFILREIRIKKTKSASAVVQPEPYQKLHPTASRGTVDTGDSRESEINLDSVSASILKPSKVIDYGHIGKYNAGVEVGKIGESSSTSNVKPGILRMDTVSGGSHSQDLQQRTLTEVKVSTSSGASCREQVSSSSIGSLRSSLAPSSTTSTPITPTQASQYLFNMFNFPKKDTDMRQLNPDTSKSLPPKLPKPSRPSTATPNPPKILTRGVHPQRPGLVVFDSKHKIPKAVESEKQPTPICPPPNTPPNALQPKQQQINQMQQPEPIPPQRRTFSALKTLPPQPVKSGGVPATAAAAPPVTHQQIPTLVKGVPQKTTASLPPTQTEVSKSLPTEAMIRDYAAATPKVFPHTCTLCKKESAHLKDWISHHNTILHLENCKLFQKRFPKWKDPVFLPPSAASKDPKPSPSTPAQTSKSQSKENKWSSSSPSRSPHRQRGPDDRRDRSRSRSPRRRYSSDNRDKHSSRSNSRSPHRSSDSRREKRTRSRSAGPNRRSDSRREKRTRSRSASPHRRSESRRERRSRSRSASPHRRTDSRREKRSRSRSASPHRRSESRREKRSRSRSTSPHRRSESRREKRSRSRSTSPHRHSESRKEKHSRSRSPRSKQNRRSRTRSRSNSPRHSRNTSSRYRSRSRSRERRSSPRRRDEKRSPRRSRERRPSTERSSSTERLAKKLLEKTGVQSLSKHSDLEAMVKTLAPALLAELAKMKSLASSSSAPSSSAPSSTAPSSSSSSSAKKEKSESSSSGKPEDNSSPPTKVILFGIEKFMSHSDVISAVNKIGKTKSVVIIRSKSKAVVRFEKEEVAQMVNTYKTLDIKGTKVFIYTKRKRLTKQAKAPNPPNKSATSDGTATTTKSAGKGKESAAASESKKPTTAKPAAKATAMVSKATAASTSKAVKTVKTENPDKKEPVKTAKANKDAPQPPGPQKTKVQAKTPAGNAKKPVVQNKTGKPLAKTPAKATASKTADAKVSAKTPQKPKTASESAAGAKTTNEEKQKAESTQPETAGSPSGGAKTVKTETVENPTAKPATGSDKKEAANLHKVAANPVELREVKQEEAMEVEVSPGVKEVQDFPPQCTDKSTPEEPPKADASLPQEPEKACTEASQSPDPPKESLPQGPETEAAESSAEVKVEPQQVVNEEDGPLEEKTQNNESKADGDASAVSAETAKATPETAGGRQETKADPAADGTHGKNTSKLTTSKNVKTDKKEDSPTASTSSQMFENKIPRIDENLYRAFTAALREHKLKKNNPSENTEEKKQEKVDDKEDALSSSTFDEQNFNLEDFVTLDEISEDVDDTDKTEKQSKDEPSAAKKSSPSKNSPSKSTKNQKDSSEPSKPSTLSKASKTSSSSSSQSDSQPSKTASTKPSPSPSGRTTRSSAAARKAEETSQKQKVETRAAKTAAAKSDHSVAAESSAVKSVKSEAKIEPPSEVDSKPQMQSPKTKEDDGEKRENLDVQKDASHPSSNEAPTPEDLQAPEMITEENKTEIQTQDSFTENQTSAGDDGDNRPEQTLLPEGDATQSDKPTAGNEIDPDSKTETNQTPSSVESEGNIKATDTRTEEVSETSEQTSADKEQPVNPDADKELETLSQQQVKAEDEATEEEDEEYHVIDAIDDQPTTTESETDINEEQRKEVGAGGHGATRMSGQKSKASSDEKEESPKKRDRKAIKTETQMKKPVRQDEKTEEDTEDDPEDMIFEVLDSVEDESVLGMQEEKTSSVKREEEDPENERSISTRSTRGRRAANQDEVKKDDLSSRRSTPTRQSLRQKEKLPKTEDEAPPKESTSTEKSGDVIKDTSEEDPASEDQPPLQAKPRRGRPKKNTKKGKKQVAAPKKAESPVKEVEEDEDEFQIIDSVEGEAADAPASMDQTESTGASSSKDEETKSETTTGLLLNEEEEPLYQILDSVEDDAPQEEPTPTEVSNVKVDEDAKEKSPIETEDATASEDQKKVQLPSADGGDGSSTEDTTPKTEEEPPSSSQSADAASTENDTTMSKNALKNLDEVSEEEEDYPDDTAEEEELNKRLAAAKEREREREEKRAQDRERERKSRSRSRGRSHRSPEKEKVDLETQELVTLDEVGADDAGEPDFEGLDSAVMEGELQDLVTLDEIIEEEEEEGKESRTDEPLIQEGQSEDPLKPETTAEESTTTDDQKPVEEAAEKSSTAAKRKHDDDAEESSNLSVVDDLVKAEDEEKTVTTPKPRGRPKKKGRQTAVRKSTRGKESSTEDEKKDEELESLDSASTVDKETSESLGDDKTEIQKPEEVMSLPDVETTSTVEQLQPEITDKGMQEGLVMENKKDEHVIEPKGNKRQQELIGPESKRARSESPTVSNKFLLPPYNPKSPIGQEHVVPKSGFFCNICSIFYLTEKAAKEVHCSSQRHYENLQNPFYKDWKPNSQEEVKVEPKQTDGEAADRKAEETSRKQKAETRAAKTAVAKSDHSVAAESSAVKTVESEAKIEPPSKVDSKHQMQSPRTDLKDEICKDEKKKDAKTKEDDGEHTRKRGRILMSRKMPAIRAERSSNT
ncbi:Zinc finger protein 638 [Oryzias melastigma]|uniref:Zinc finger protein 638 n=1 Tax=Oryzias melastigma TaxID=30732 RepID=A0A834FJW7_ORYME|nr:Zinc finger protein 638 [Oryzias melastigma]